MRIEHSTPTRIEADEQSLPQQSKKQADQPQGDLATFLVDLVHALNAEQPGHLSSGESPSVPSTLAQDIEAFTKAFLNQTPTTSQSATVTPGTFNADFSSPLDQNKWTTADYGIPAATSVFKPSAVTSESGKLKMTIAPDGAGGYTAGEIDSTQKYGFGHYEATMQAVGTPGVVTSFNAYGDPKTAVNMEVVGNNPRQIQLTTQTATGDKSQIVDLPFDTSQGMHKYAFDWAPDHVDFYADGAKIATLSDPSAIPQQPMGILANTWVSNDPQWTGTFPNPSQPLNSYYGGISYSPS